MSGKRVFELAREFDMSSKDLLEEIRRLGIEMPSHMTALDEKLTEFIRNKIKKKRETSDASKAFQGIKKTSKTILIKRKDVPKVEEPEKEIKEIPAPRLVEEPEKEKKIVELEKEKPIEKEAKEAIEEEVVKEDKEILAEVPVKEEEEKEVVSEQAVEAVEEIKEEVRKEEEKEKETEENEREEKITVKIEEVEEALERKEHKKKTLKTIYVEPEEDIFISHKWKSFKTIPKKEKRAKALVHPKKTKTTQPSEITKPRKKVLKIYEGITVKEFADLIGQKSSTIMAKLIEMGVMVTINQPIDLDAAILIADSYGLKVEVEAEKKLEDYIEEEEDRPESLKPRAPVVTVMGHVDHGKTSLLDAIRKTRVIEVEAGGITQHIGAYVVEMNGKKVVFLDTPGHEAFTAMRARGAKVTDIVVLVVAADDGVMPQTVEAINHARAAEVPIIVAINKIDKPEANPERIRNELTKYGLIPEEWGGENIFVEVSAKKHVGLEHLIEMILLQAEVLELKANPDKKARGVILEAKLDKGRGPAATVLVQTGTLKQGDFFVCGHYYGRVRLLLNEDGKYLQQAPPATPVEVIGFSGVPQSGDTFIVVDDERIAKSIANERLQKERLAGLEKAKKVTLDELYSQIKTGEVHELNLIIKADVQGSLEAVSDALIKLSTDAVKVRIIHGGVGGITETDVMLASASNAIIIGFNVRPDPKTSALAEKEKVDIRLYNIIYNAVDDIRAAMAGLLEPTIKEKITGRAEVRKVFHISRIGTVAGCYVTEGAISRSNSVRLVRDNVEVYRGKMASLKRFKDDVREVQTGYECGISLENFNDIKEGDIIEAFIVEKFAAQL